MHILYDSQVYKCETWKNTCLVKHGKLPVLRRKHFGRTDYWFEDNKKELIIGIIWCPGICNHITRMITKSD
jgi:hypothetical protein